MYSMYAPDHKRLYVDAIEARLDMCMGTEDFLSALLDALGTNTELEYCEFIARMYDVDISDLMEEV